jgi:hypothetical protein
VEIWAEPANGAEMPERDAAIRGGVATYRACLATRALGHEAWVQVHPNPREPFLAAMIHVGVRRSVAPEDRTEYETLVSTHEFGGPYRSWRLPFTLITRLEEAAESEGGYFRVLSSAEIARVTGAVGTPGRDHQTASVADKAADRAAAGRVGGQNRPMAARVGLETRDGERQPTLAVLSTPGDSLKDWVRAGMAFARVALLGRQHGVAMTVVHTPVDCLCEHARLSSVALGSDHPQVVVELGYPQDTTAMPGRSARPPREEVAAGERPYHHGPVAPEPGPPDRDRLAGQRWRGVT